MIGRYLVHKKSCATCLWSFFPKSRWNRRTSGEVINTVKVVVVALMVAVWISGDNNCMCRSLSLRVENLEGSNYVCRVAGLWGSIIPDKCYHKVCAGLLANVWLSAMVALVGRWLSGERVEWVKMPLDIGIFLGQRSVEWDLCSPKILKGFCADAKVIEATLVKLCLDVEIIVSDLHTV